MAWKAQKAEIPTPFSKPQEGAFKNPYDAPANAIDKQFYSPDDPVGAFNAYGNEMDSDATQSKADPIATIMADFKDAQARVARPKGRGIK